MLTGLTADSLINRPKAEAMAMIPNRPAGTINGDPSALAEQRAIAAGYTEQDVKNGQHDETTYSRRSRQLACDEPAR